MTYDKQEENFQKKLIKDSFIFVDKDDYEDGKSHVLKDGRKNLYKEIRKPALKYFYRNKIGWWQEGNEPTGSTKSSQVACLNHLFALRDDEKAVEKIVKGIDDRFTGVLPIPSAYDKREKEKGKTKLTYIAFEVVSTKDHLEEGTSTRGANCTSIDALIYAKQGDEKWLIVIEWKYTEKCSKTIQSDGKSGKTRMKRYNKLIQESAYLESLCKMEMDDYSTAEEYKDSIYYQETFYQLMRQTLWAEQVIKHRKNGRMDQKESFEAKQYLHLHVIPKGNDEFRRGGETEKEWTSMLTEEGKKRYKTIDPEELLAPIAQNPSNPDYKNDYKELIAYLKKRYWDRP